MSTLTLRGNPSGSGTFTVESPNSNNSRTLTLPDATTTLVGTDATQTMTNKTIQSSTIQGGALTLATLQTPGVVTSIDFTGIPSWAKRVTVLFQEVSLNAATTFQVRLGTSGGFVSTGYLGAGVAITTGGTAMINLSDGFTIYDNTPLATNLCSGVMTLTTMGSNIWVAHGRVGTSEAASRSRECIGSLALGGVLTQLQVRSTNGTATFDGGSINVMWEG